MLNNACIAASIKNKNILLPSSIFQHFHLTNHPELDLTVTFWGAEVAQQKVTKSKIKDKEKTGKIDNSE